MLCKFTWLVFGAYGFNFTINASFGGFVGYFEHVIFNSFLLSLHAFLVKKKKENKTKRLPLATQLPGAGHQQKQSSVGKNLHDCQWVNCVTNAPRKWSHTATSQRLENRKQGEVILSVTFSLTHLPLAFPIPYVPFRSQLNDRIPIK